MRRQPGSDPLDDLRERRPDDVPQLVRDALQGEWGDGEDGLGRQRIRIDRVWHGRPMMPAATGAEGGGKGPTSVRVAAVDRGTATVHRCGHDAPPGRAAGKLARGRLAPAGGRGRAGGGMHPDFEPSIAKLGPGQVVLIGTTGDPVPGGRAFHVERWFNATGPATITIAFKEGEPVGDCSYPVFPGWHMLIAPYQEVPGRLSVDFGTLQADVDSDLGRQYIAEAERLFGPRYRRRSPTLGRHLRMPGTPGACLDLLVVAVVVAVTAQVVRERRDRRSGRAGRATRPSRRTGPVAIPRSRLRRDRLPPGVGM